MTVTANIHEAKTTLSKLIERALAGEDVVIAKAGKPVVKLTPVTEAGAAPFDRASLFGSMRGKIIVSEDWEEPVFDETMLGKLYGSIEDQSSAQAQAQAHAAEAGKAFKSP